MYLNILIFFQPRIRGSFILQCLFNRNGLPHGFGTLYFKNGTTVDGRFDTGIIKEIIPAGDDNQEPTAAPTTSTPTVAPKTTAIPARAALTTTTTTTVGTPKAAKYFTSPIQVMSYSAGRKVHTNLKKYN